MNQNTDLFIGLVAMSAIRVLALWFLGRRHRNHWFEIGYLKEINLFPLKSVKGIGLEEAWCNFDGLRTATDNGFVVKDRSLIVVTATFTMVTARQKPKLLGIRCSISDDGLILNAPGMEEFIITWNKEDSPIQTTTIVWGDTTEGVDCGDKAAEWLNRFLGTEGYRILQSTDKSSKRILSLKADKWCQNAKKKDEVTYQDAFPYMLLTSSSLKDLQNRMFAKYSINDVPVNQDYFRPSLYVQSGCPPFNEDDWKEIKIGECHFYNIKPCDRCLLTTINLTNFIRRKDNEPLQTLRSFRLLYPEFGQDPCFGINLTLIKSGKIKVGDRVFIKRS